MKSLEKKLNELDKSFDDLFLELENDYEVEAKVLASKILSEIKHLTDRRNLNRKDIAELLGTSASYLTQLYRGNKLLNLVTLAKFKNKLDINIEINVTEKSYSNTVDDFCFSKIKRHRADNNYNWMILINNNSNNIDLDIDNTNKSKTNKKSLYA